MASGDHLVAKKDDFTKKKVEKSRYYKDPPGQLIAWYITQFGDRGGFPCNNDFFRLFFRKIVFLSDQMVPGGHKNISG